MGIVVSTEANNIFIKLRHNTVNRVAYERNMATEKQKKRLQMKECFDKMVGSSIYKKRKTRNNKYS